jgi:hypothetical protein
LSIAQSATKSEKYRHVQHELEIDAPKVPRLLLCLVARFFLTSQGRRIGRFRRSKISSISNADNLCLPAFTHLKTQKGTTLSVLREFGNTHCLGRQPLPSHYRMSCSHQSTISDFYLCNTNKRSAAGRAGERIRGGIKDLQANPWRGSMRASGCQPHLVRLTNRLWTTSPRSHPHDHIQRPAARPSNSQARRKCTERYLAILDRL